MAYARLIAGRGVASSERKLAIPILRFAAVLSAYVTSVAILVAGNIYLTVAAVPVAGILIVMLFVIGHDACHQSFTRSRWVNNVIGRIAFLPALHAYSLWEHEHNRRHHGFNNIRNLDYAWIPLSPREFRNAGVIDRLKYRVYRDPGGVLLYYLIEIWPRRKIIPRNKFLGRVRAVHWVDSALVLSFLAVCLTILAVAGPRFGKSVAEVWLVGALLPFLIFSALFSAAIYLHHTHYDVPWYDSIEQWKKGNGSVLGTVHVEFPWIVRVASFNIMEHNAHHLAPTTPHYHLAAAQKDAIVEGVVVWTFTMRGYFDVCARCKLFDYEAARWLDFHEQPTGGKPAMATHGH